MLQHGVKKTAELEAKILEVGAGHVAAFIAEPILASGGVIVPPEGYHKRCLEICRCMMFCIYRMRW